MSHFIEKCRCCEEVISQCRCPSSDKAIRWSTCRKCAGIENPAGYQAQEEVDVAKLVPPSKDSQKLDGSVFDADAAARDSFEVELLRQWSTALGEELYQEGKIRFKVIVGDQPSTDRTVGLALRSSGSRSTDRATIVAALGSLARYFAMERDNKERADRLARVI